MPAQPPSEMSGRMVLLLGGAAAVIVAAVLGASLLLRGVAGQAPGGAQPLPVSPVSAGTRVVPDVTGLAIQVAEKRLADAGARVAAVVRVPSARHADTVVRTYPGAGEGLPPGARVTLYVSSH